MKESPGRITRLAALLVCGLLIDAATAGHPRSVGIEAASLALLAAMNSQDAATMAGKLTTDVELMGESTAVKGRDAAIEKLREIAARGRLSATTREIKVDGDFAWHVAIYTQTEKNGDVHARGHVIAIWKRVNGTWQLHRMMAPGLIEPGIPLERPSTKDPVLDRPGHSERT